MIRAVLSAIAFLTRLPVRAGPVLGRDLGRSVAFFPLAGLLLGLILTGVAYGLSGSLPSLMVAVLIVALHAALTGALHLDGLADLFDGLAGGHGDRDRTLAIMRDSRIGAVGAVALVLVLVAKVVAVGAVLDARDFTALVAFPALARWAITPQIVLFPYARADGLGGAFTGEAGLKELAMATATIAILTAVLGLGVVRAGAVALFTSMAIALWLRSRLGGLTGDVYGATVELAETAALFAASLR